MHIKSLDHNNNQYNDNQTKLKCVSNNNNNNNDVNFIIEKLKIFSEKYGKLLESPLAAQIAHLENDQLFIDFFS